MESVSYTHLDVYKRQEGIPIEEVETAITTTEPTQGEEMEPQAGDKGEATGGMDLQKLWELINENFKKQKDCLLYTSFYVQAETSSYTLVFSIRSTFLTFYGKRKNIFTNIF